MESTEVGSTTDQLQNLRGHDHARAIRCSRCAQALGRFDGRTCHGKAGCGRGSHVADRELSRIDAQQKAEGANMQSGMQQEVAALNARVDAQAKRAADWNARSKALDTEANAYEDNRIDWKLNCGDRRYREDDEKAIRAGK